MRNPLTPAESPSPELLGRTCNLLLCLAVTARIERQRDGRREECRDAAGIDAEAIAAAARSVVGARA